MTKIIRGKSSIKGLEEDLDSIHQKLDTLEEVSGENVPADNKLYAKVNKEWMETGDVLDPETGAIVADLGTY